LRQDPPGPSESPAGAFQSHAGSIEAQERRGGIHGSSSFQSHAGSIEASTGSRTISKRQRFQSHAGSIEAHDIPQRPHRYPLSFNPTLVRLRPRPVAAPGALPPRFNPTLVRLRRQRRKRRKPWGCNVSIPRWFD